MVYGKLIVGLFEDLMHGWFGVETTYYFYFKIIIIFVQSIFLFLFLFFYFYVLVISYDFPFSLICKTTV
jgi:hypothetical protein